MNFVERIGANFIVFSVFGFYLQNFCLFILTNLTRPLWEYCEMAIFLWKLKVLSDVFDFP